MVEMIYWYLSRTYQYGYWVGRLAIYCNINILSRPALLNSAWLCIFRTSFTFSWNVKLFSILSLYQSCLASTSFVYSGGSSLADSALRKSADGNVFYTQQGHRWTVGLNILGLLTQRCHGLCVWVHMQRGNNWLPASTQLLLRSLPVLRLVLIRRSSLVWPRRSS